MKFIDLFSGIGGFRSALEKNGYECIAYSEIDKYAKKSYQAIYDTEDEIDLGNITQISEEYLSKFKEENDIVVGGSPCQSFSIAGGRRGFEDTRGTLFFEYAKVVKETQPKIFLYENVKGMLSHDKQNTIKTVLSTFDELGYYIDFNIFNSKFYDVPQNRERIYIVGIRKDLIKKPISQEESKGKKKFDEIHNWAVENINYKKILPPLKDNVSTRLVDILEKTVDEKFFLSEDKISQLTLNEDFSGKLNHYNYNELDKVHSIYKEAPTINTMQGGGRQPKIVVVGNTSNTNHKSHDIHDPNGLSPTIAARDYKGPKQIAIKEATKKGYTLAKHGDSVNYTYPTSKTRRGRVGKQIAQTIQAGEVNQGVVTNDIRIRKLTPLECWRLQGFTDDQFYKAKNDGVSNSQLYKQAGNSVTVNVVDYIISNVVNEIDKENE